MNRSFLDFGVCILCNIQLTPLTLIGRIALAPKAPACGQETRRGIEGDGHPICFNSHIIQLKPHSFLFVQRNAEVQKHLLAERLRKQNEAL